MPTKIQRPGPVHFDLRDAIPPVPCVPTVSSFLSIISDDNGSEEEISTILRHSWSLNTNAPPLVQFLYKREQYQRRGIGALDLKDQQDQQAPLLESAGMPLLLGLREYIDFVQHGREHTV